MRAFSLCRVRLLRTRVSVVYMGPLAHYCT